MKHWIHRVAYEVYRKVADVQFRCMARGDKRLLQELRDRIPPFRS